MEKDLKTKNSKIVKRSYLARDFDGFKSNLVQHAKTFFPDNIEDFTEAGLGGMFVDMIAYIGDSLSYYLDHQFNELKWSEAVEIENVKKHLELAGVKTYGASPSTVYVQFYVIIPFEENSQDTIDEKYLPIIKEGTRLVSENGITFNLLEDLDFTRSSTEDVSRKQWELSNPQPTVTNGGKVINLSGLCVSGETESEDFFIPDSFVPFREVTLSNQNVSEIEKVFDSDGNIYYEVDNLSQDNVFIIREQRDYSSSQIEKIVGVIPAPYRFTKTTDPQTLSTTLTFGGGDSAANDDDILPDPADLSVPLYGKKVFSSFALDPNSLLKTNTLGVAPRSTTLTVKYRHGGGFAHNVNSNSIKEIQFIDMTFPTNDSLDHDKTVGVRSSVAVRNKHRATGGSPAPTLEDLRSQIPAARNSQRRIVTKEDLISRIYSIPSSLGRIFRASISEAPDSNGVIEVAIISRDSSGHLTRFGTLNSDAVSLKITPDSMKLNLKKYLESFRLINDSYILLDAAVHNFGLNITVIATPDAIKNDVAISIISNLKKILDVRNFQINQPLSIGDINYAVMNSEGVSSIFQDGIKILSLVNSTSDGTNSFMYSTNQFNPKKIERGFIFPKKNGIFELKYPDFDIKVTVL